MRITGGGGGGKETDEIFETIMNFSINVRHQTTDPGISEITKQ